MGQVQVSGGKKPTGRKTTVGYDYKGTQAQGEAVLQKKAALMVGKSHPTKGTVTLDMDGEVLDGIVFGSLTEQSEDATLVFTSEANPEDNYTMPVQNLSITKYRPSDNVVNIGHADMTALQTALRADRGVADLTLTSGTWGK